MILITGATGTVGRELVAQLLDRGQEVRVLVRAPSRLGDLRGRVEASVGDLNDPATLPPALAGVTGIFLLTSNTAHDIHMIDAARAAGAQHIVKLSTQEAGWEPVEGHGHWHREREQLIMKSGLAWTFLRPTMFMSTALDWIPMIEAEGKVFFPMGTGRLAPIDPADVAAVAAVALTTEEHRNKGFELTGGQVLSCAEMVDTLSGVLGTPIQYVDIPAPVAGEQMRRAGLPGYVTDGLLETFRLVRDGRFGYATDVVEQVTGRQPRTFRQWCERHRPLFRTPTS